MEMKWKEESHDGVKWQQKKEKLKATWWSTCCCYCLRLFSISISIWRLCALITFWMTIMQMLSKIMHSIFMKWSEKKLMHFMTHSRAAAINRLKYFHYWTLICAICCHCILLFWRWQKTNVLFSMKAIPDEIMTDSFASAGLIYLFLNFFN